MDPLLLGFLVVATMVSVCAAGTRPTCGPDQYKNKMGECCPVCGKGSFIFQDCTERSSTKCTPCMGDTYMDQPNGLDKCFECETCDSSQGLLTLQKCTIFSNAVCAVQSGYYCVRYTQNNECRSAEKHSACSPGQRIKTPGTDSTDTVCEDCREGSFSTDGINCTEHANCAVHGEEFEVKGTSTKDSQCKKPSRHRYVLMVPVSLLAFVIAFLRWRFKRTQACQVN